MPTHEQILERTPKPTTLGFTRRAANLVIGASGPIRLLGRVVLAMFIVWYLHRTWTYVYFTPQITEWSDGSAPLTPEQIDQAGRRVALGWIRNTIDATAAVLLVAVALIPVRKPSSTVLGGAAPTARRSSHPRNLPT